MMHRTCALVAALVVALPIAGRGAEPPPVTAPVALDEGVFNGVAKGFIAPDRFVLSPRLENMAFTGFFGEANGSTVVDYVLAPAAIPPVGRGDAITLASGSLASAFQAMEAQGAAGSIIVVPVVAIGADGHQGIVRGFATLRVEQIGSKGNGKCIDTRLVQLDLPAASE